MCWDFFLSVLFLVSILTKMPKRLVIFELALRMRITHALKRKPISKADTHLILPTFLSFDLTYRTKIHILFIYHRNSLLISATIMSTAHTFDRYTHTRFWNVLNYQQQHLSLQSKFLTSIFPAVSIIPDEHTKTNVISKDSLIDSERERETVSICCGCNASHWIMFWCVC